MTGPRFATTSDVTHQPPLWAGKSPIGTTSRGPTKQVSVSSPIDNEEPPTYQTEPRYVCSVKLGHHWMAGEGIANLYMFLTLR
jgi:hypothetical protein